MKISTLSKKILNDDIIDRKLLVLDDWVDDVQDIHYLSNGHLKVGNFECFPVLGSSSYDLHPYWVLTLVQGSFVGGVVYAANNKYIIIETLWHEFLRIPLNAILSMATGKVSQTSLRERIIECDKEWIESKRKVPVYNRYNENGNKILSVLRCVTLVTGENIIGTEIGELFCGIFLDNNVFGRVFIPARYIVSVSYISYYETQISEEEVSRILSENESSPLKIPCDGAIHVFHYFEKNGAYLACRSRFDSSRNGIKEYEYFVIMRNFESFNAAGVDYKVIAVKGGCLTSDISLMLNINVRFSHADYPFVFVQD